LPWAPYSTPLVTTPSMTKPFSSPVEPLTTMVFANAAVFAVCVDTPGEIWTMDV
jgi:hypothetical protein